MNAAQAPAAPLAGVDDWLSQLKWAVRPEFAVDVYRPDPHDPVLGAPPCEVPACDLPQAGRGLCTGHDQQWRKNQQQPALPLFIHTAGPLVGHDLPHPCLVSGCIGAAFRRGLCNAHWMRYRKSTDTDLASWVTTTTSSVRRQSAAECDFDGCGYPVRGTGRWCDFHARRWEKAGKPDPHEWVQDCRDYGRTAFRVNGLPEPLRTELQYVLQCRRDESRSKLRPWTLHRLAHIATEHGVSSLRDLPEHAVVGGHTGQTRALLRWSHDRLRRLQAKADGDLGFDADVWNLRHLGCEPHASRRAVHVRFERIPQPWLRHTVKRWLRARLVTGFAGGTLQNDARQMTGFAAWAHSHRPSLDGFGGIDRNLLEDWLTALHLDARNRPHQRNSHIGTLRTFFDDCRRHGWAPDLPATAALYRSDFHREPDLLPRALPEHIIGQLESDDALALVGDQTCETILRVLIDTGLRIGHVLRLPATALQPDPSGHWCLHVLDTKVRREHAVPLADKLADHLHRQREHVHRRWPDVHQLMLFPRPTGNPDGQRPYAYGTFRDRLQAWLERCDIHDEQRNPVKVTAHQFRHTLGTRMKVSGIASDATFDEVEDRVSA